MTSINHQASGLVLILSAVVVLASCGHAAAAEAETMTIEETVHDAAAIIVGRVEHLQSRWADRAHRRIVTDCTFNVEKVILASSEVKRGRPLTLTFWGGSLGGETQSIPDLHLPVKGSRYLLMLRPQWQTPGFTPTVGFTNGMFRILEGSLGNRQMVTDADGLTLFSTVDKRILRASETGEKTRAAKVSAGVTLNAFVAWLEANLPRIKGSNPKQRS